MTIKCSQSVHSIVFPLASSLVDKDQKNQNGHKNKCGKCIHFRLNALFNLGVDFGGKGIYAGTLRKVRDDKIIQGHRKGH